MRALLFTISLTLTVTLFGQPIPDTSLLQMKAPDKFQVEFQTEIGDFLVEVIRDWSPLGADRFYQLVYSGYYENNCIFRVQPEYVCQFGISDFPEITAFWDSLPIADEVVKVSNAYTTVAYARDGANSRTTQLYINYHDNSKLDTVDYNGLRGFPPFGKVIRGMHVVESFYSEYGFAPAEIQDSVYKYGNSYLDKHFPGLTYIKKAVLVEQE